MAEAGLTLIANGTVVRLPAEQAREIVKQLRRRLDDSLGATGMAVVIEECLAADDERELRVEATSTEESALRVALEAWLIEAHGPLPNEAMMLRYALYPSGD